MGSDHLVEWSQRDLNDLVREALSYKSTVALIKFIQIRAKIEGIGAVLIDREVVRIDSLLERRQTVLEDQMMILLRDAATLRHHVADKVYLRVFIDVVTQLAGHDENLVRQWFERYCHELVMDTAVRLDEIRRLMSEGETVLSSEIEKVHRDLVQIIFYTEDWDEDRPSEEFVASQIWDVLVMDLCGCPGALRERLHELNIECADILLDALDFD